MVTGWLGGLGGEGAAWLQVSSSLKTPGNTCTLLRSHLSPGQQTAVPEQSPPVGMHAPGGGGEGGSGEGGVKGGCGGLGERSRKTTGGEGGGDGCGGGDGLRNRLPEPVSRSPPCVLSSSCLGMSVIASHTPSTSARKSSRRRHPRLEQPNQVLENQEADALFSCSSSPSGTTVTTGTSFASVGTVWCRKGGSARSDWNVSCMPCFSISTRASDSLNEKARGGHAPRQWRAPACARGAVGKSSSMDHLAVAASVALLLVVSVVSTRVLMRVLMPSREEVQRLQNDRIERMLREESDAHIDMVEVL